MSSEGLEFRDYRGWGLEPARVQYGCCKDSLGALRGFHKGFAKASIKVFKKAWERFPHKAQQSFVRAFSGIGGGFIKA